MLNALAWPETALVCLSVLAAGFLRGLTGFGFALAAVPAMSFFLPPSQAVAMAVLLQSLAGLKDSVTLRGTWDGPIPVLVMIANLLTDIAYRRIDPRMRKARTL